MSFQFHFPKGPIPGQVVTGPNGATWIWDGRKWVGGMGGPYLPIAGGVMEGPIIVNGPFTDPDQVVNKDYVDEHAWRPAPFDGQTFGQMQGQWNPVLPMTGGFMRGPINMDYFRLNGIRWPIEPDDAVPKEYVDELLGFHIWFEWDPPPDPHHAMLWATPAGQLFIYDDRLEPPAWIQIAGPSLGSGGSGGPAVIYFQPNPPADPHNAMLWATPSAELFIYDGFQRVWLQLAGEGLPVGPGGGGGAIVSDTAPPNPILGAIWLNTTNDELSVWDGTAWVAISGTGGGIGEAPTDGQLYMRQGSTASWQPFDLVDGGVY